MHAHAHAQHLLDLHHPFKDVVKGFALRHVVHQENALRERERDALTMCARTHQRHTYMRPPKIGGSDGSKTLLAGGIPDLRAHNVIVA